MERSLQTVMLEKLSDYDFIFSHNVSMAWGYILIWCNAHVHARGMPRLGFDAMLMAMN